jgi:circadian clock protein KaiC
MTVIKMRGSAHSKDFREYEITHRGIKMGGSLKEYCGILTGITQRRTAWEAFPGLTARETQLLLALTEFGEASMTTLGQCTGLDHAALTAALQRLRDLNYVFSRGEAEQAIYRPAIKIGKDPSEQGVNSE